MAALTGWFGGKNSMSNWIYSNIPKDIKNYAEVFSGSMAIYFNEDFTNCENIVFNDFNKLQANFMACCKDYEKMLKYLDSAFLKDGFLYCEEKEVDKFKKHYRDLYTNTKNPEKCDFYDNLNFNIPDFDRAVIYSFMITSAFNACHARGAGFSGITKTNKLKLTLTCAPEVTPWSITVRHYASWKNSSCLNFLIFLSERILNDFLHLSQPTKIKNFINYFLVIYRLH